MNILDQMLARKSFSQLLGLFPHTSKTLRCLRSEIEATLTKEDLENCLKEISEDSLVEEIGLQALIQRKADVRLLEFLLQRSATKKRILGIKGYLDAALDLLHRQPTATKGGEVIRDRLLARLGEATAVARELWVQYQLMNLEAMRQCLDHYYDALHSRGAADRLTDELSRLLRSDASEPRDDFVVQFISAILQCLPQRYPSYPDPLSFIGPIVEAVFGTSRQVSTLTLKALFDNWIELCSRRGYDCNEKTRTLLDALMMRLHQNPDVEQIGAGLQLLYEAGPAGIADWNRLVCESWQSTLQHSVYLRNWNKAKLLVDTLLRKGLISEALDTEKVFLMPPMSEPNQVMLNNEQRMYVIQVVLELRRVMHCLELARTLLQRKEYRETGKLELDRKLAQIVSESCDHLLHDRYSYAYDRIVKFIIMHIKWWLYGGTYGRPSSSKRSR